MSYQRISANMHVKCSFWPITNWSCSTCHIINHTYVSTVVCNWFWWKHMQIIINHYQNFSRNVIHSLFVWQNKRLTPPVAVKAALTRPTREHISHLLPSLSQSQLLTPFCHSLMCPSLLPLQSFHLPLWPIPAPTSLLPSLSFLPVHFCPYPICSIFLPFTPPCLSFTICCSFI